MQTLLTRISATSKYHKYSICQLEIGAEGTPHLQGFTVYSAQVLLGEVSSLEKNGSGFLGAFDENTNHPHVERAKGSNAQCIAYCTKEETKKWGPWENGDVAQTEEKKRGRPKSEFNDIEWCAQKIDSGEWECWDDVPTATKISMIGPNIQKFFDKRRADNLIMAKRNVRAFVLVGEAGWGKSTMVWQMAQEQGWRIMTRQIGGGTNQWYSNVDGDYDLLFLDEFDAGQMKLTEFNQLLDGFPLLLPSKGKQGYATFTKVVIASNYDPKTWFQRTMTTKEMNDYGHMVTVVDNERQKHWEDRRETALRRIGIFQPNVAQYATNGRTIILPSYQEIIDDGWVKDGKADLAQARYETRHMMTQWLGGDVTRCVAGDGAVPIPPGSPDIAAEEEPLSRGDTQMAPPDAQPLLPPGSPFYITDSSQFGELFL